MLAVAGSALSSPSLLICPSELDFHGWPAVSLAGSHDKPSSAENSRQTAGD